MLILYFKQNLFRFRKCACVLVFKQVEVVDVFETGTFAWDVVWRNDDVTDTALEPLALPVSWELTTSWNHRRPHWHYNRPLVITHNSTTCSMKYVPCSILKLNCQGLMSRTPSVLPQRFLLCHLSVLTFIWHFNQGRTWRALACKQVSTCM